MPDGWNGTLMLFSHGYYPDAWPPAPEQVRRPRLPPRRPEDMLVELAVLYRLEGEAEFGRLRPGQ